MCLSFNTSRLGRRCCCIHVYIICAFNDVNRWLFKTRKSFLEFQMTRFLGQANNQQSNICCFSSASMVLINSTSSKPVSLKRCRYSSVNFNEDIKFSNVKFWSISKYSRLAIKILLRNNGVVCDLQEFEGQLGISWGYTWYSFTGSISALHKST